MTFTAAIAGLATILNTVGLCSARKSSHRSTRNEDNDYAVVRCRVGGNFCQNGGTCWKLKPNEITRMNRSNEMVYRLQMAALTTKENDKQMVLGFRCTCTNEFYGEFCEYRAAVVYLTRNWMIAGCCFLLTLIIFLTALIIYTIRKKRSPSKTLIISRDPPEDQRLYLNEGNEPRNYSSMNNQGHSDGAFLPDSRRSSTRTITIHRPRVSLRQTQAPPRTDERVVGLPAPTSEPQKRLDGGKVGEDYNRTFHSSPDFDSEEDRFAGSRASVESTDLNFTSGSSDLRKNRESFRRPTRIEARFSEDVNLSSDSDLNREENRWQNRISHTNPRPRRGDTRVIKYEHFETELNTNVSSSPEPGTSQSVYHRIILPPPIAISPASRLNTNPLDLSDSKLTSFNRNRKGVKAVQIHSPGGVSSPSKRKAKYLENSASSYSKIHSGKTPEMSSIKFKRHPLKSNKPKGWTQAGSIKPRGSSRADQTRRLKGCQVRLDRAIQRRKSKESTGTIVAKAMNSPPEDTVTRYRRSVQGQVSPPKYRSLRSRLTILPSAPQKPFANPDDRRSSVVKTTSQRLCPDDVNDRQCMENSVENSGILCTSFDMVDDYGKGIPRQSKPLGLQNQVVNLEASVRSYVHEGMDEISSSSGSESKMNECAVQRQHQKETFVNDNTLSIKVTSSTENTGEIPINTREFSTKVGCNLCLSKISPRKTSLVNLSSEQNKELSKTSRKMTLSAGNSKPKSEISKAFADIKPMPLKKTQMKQVEKPPKTRSLLEFKPKLLKIPIEKEQNSLTRDSEQQKSFDSTPLPSKFPSILTDLSIKSILLRNEEFLKSFKVSPFKSNRNSNRKSTVKSVSYQESSIRTIDYIPAPTTVVNPGEVNSSRSGRHTVQALAKTDNFMTSVCDVRDRNTSLLRFENDNKQREATASNTVDLETLKCKDPLLRVVERIESIDQSNNNMMINLDHSAVGGSCETGADPSQCNTNDVGSEKVSSFRSPHKGLRYKVGKRSSKGQRFVTFGANKSSRKKQKRSGNDVITVTRCEGREQGTSGERCQGTTSKESGSLRVDGFKCLSSKLQGMANDQGGSKGEGLSPSERQLWGGVSHLGSTQFVWNDLDKSLTAGKTGTQRQNDVLLVGKMMSSSVLSKILVESQGPHESIERNRQRTTTVRGRSISSLSIRPEVVAHGQRSFSDAAIALKNSLEIFTKGSSSFSVHYHGRGDKGMDPESSGWDTVDEATTDNNQDHTAAAPTTTTTTTTTTMGIRSSRTSNARSNTYGKKSPQHQSPLREVSSSGKKPDTKSEIVETAESGGTRTSEKRIWKQTRTCFTTDEELSSALIVELKEFLSRHRLRFVTSSERAINDQT